MRGRTVLLVVRAIPQCSKTRMSAQGFEQTHNVPLILPLCEFMITLAADGTITTENVVPSPEKVADILHEVEEKEQADIIEGDTKATATDKADGKLVMAEEIKEGHMTWRSFKLLLSGIGGNRPVLFFTGWIAIHLLSDFTYMARTWFLGRWGAQYEIHPPSEVNVNL